ncbi:MAG: IS1182 family transposase [Clostridiales bacterium]|nr:IS1182 family transposase [Clostridiales bacterium]
MKYKTGINKNQLNFAPMCLDDFIQADHICRIISAFTSQLDTVALGYKYAECKNTGCPPYDPRMMLDLYLYGYLHHVRSSRRLQAETHRNVEVMWLMDGLKPDDKTISNFRKDNAKALRKTFRAFTKLCHELGLYGGKTVAIDGTKIRAGNSRKNNHNRTTVQRELARIDKRISEYMTALEEADAQEEDEAAPTSAEIRCALLKLNERKVKFEGLDARLETEREISTVDPDSRLMRQGGDGRALDVCYNVQTVVDDKHKLIVDFDVITRADDKGNLENMTALAMDAMETDAVTALADKGYYDGEDIVRCEQNGVTCLVAKPSAGGAKHSEGFTREDFNYESESDCYVCPLKNKLRFMRMQVRSDNKEYRIYANYAACAKCPDRDKRCTKSKYRQILRLSYQDTLDIVDERTRNNKQLYRKRQEIVEHPFGTIKSVWGFRQFLCRTQPKVTSETALSCMAYNLRRIVSIFRGNGGDILAAFG